MPSSICCHNNNRYLPPSLSPEGPGLLTFDSAKVFPWLEPDALSFGDRDRGPRLDIPSGSTLSRSWLEHAKASDLDAVPIEKSLLHAFREQVHDLEGGATGAGMSLHQRIGNVDLDHWRPRTVGNESRIRIKGRGGRPNAGGKGVSTSLLAMGPWAPCLYTLRG